MQIKVEIQARRGARIVAGLSPDSPKPEEEEELSEAMEEDEVEMHARA